MMKRWGVFLGIAVLCFNLIFMDTQVSAAGETYGSDYNISTILSRYQFMVEGDVDLDSGGHTVGAVVVGGSLSADNTFGDAATVPSYVGHLKKGTFGNAWHGKYPTKNETVYYGISDVPGLDSNIWKQNSGYIAVDKAFEAVKKQSGELAKTGTKLEAVNGVVTIDCMGDEDVYVYMTAETYNSASQIKISVDSVDWFRDHTCLISVTGGAGLSFDGYAKVCINNAGIGNQLKNMTGSDKEYGSQLNVGGMNLVWNFPDATGTMNVQGLGGHLVAPNAGVKFASGNYEGGVICKTLSGSAQGHFYPMSRTLPNEKTSTSETSAKTAEGSFSKLSGSQSGEALAGAVLTLMYNGEYDLSKVERVSGPVLSSKSKVSIIWKSTKDPLKLQGLPVGNYTLVETEAPEGYLFAKSSIAFEVKDDGKIYQKGSTSAIDHIKMVDEKIQKTDIQVTKKWAGDTVSERPQSIEVQLKKQGADDEVPVAVGTKVTLSASNNWTYKWTVDKTDAAGKTIKYTVEEVSVPEGYTAKQATDVNGNIVITNTYGKEDITSEEASTQETSQTSTQTPTETPTETPTTESTNERGHLTIVVYDEETGEKVPNATITVTGPDGVSREYTTNSVGEVALAYVLTGDYSIKVDSVPDGYTVKTDKTFNATVVKGETTKKEIKVASAEKDKTSEEKQTGNSSKKTESDSKKTSNAAKTGDNTPIAVNVIVMLTGIAGFVLLQFGRNRQKK